MCVDLLENSDEELEHIIRLSVQYGENMDEDEFVEMGGRKPRHVGL